MHATLDVHTGDGGITVDLPVQMSGSVRDNALHGTLNGGGPELTVRTADGSVLIEQFVASADHSFSPEVLDDRSGPGRRRVHSIR